MSSESETDITTEIELRANGRFVRVVAVVDSGARTTSIPDSLADELGLTATGSAEVEDAHGHSTTARSFEVEIRWVDERTRESFLSTHEVVDAATEVLLGSDFTVAHGLVLDCAQGRLRVPTEAERTANSDHTYERWLEAVLAALHANPRLGVDVNPSNHRFAARAVREGALIWGAGGRYVDLPGRFIPPRGMF